MESAFFILDYRLEREPPEERVEDRLAPLLRVARDGVDVRLLVDDLLYDRLLPELFL